MIPFSTLAALLLMPIIGAEVLHLSTTSTVEILACTSTITPTVTVVDVIKTASAGSVHTGGAGAETAQSVIEPVTSTVTKTLSMPAYGLYDQAQRVGADPYAVTTVPLGGFYGFYHANTKSTTSSVASVSGTTPYASVVTSAHAYGLYQAAQRVTQSGHATTTISVPAAASYGIFEGAETPREAMQRQLALVEREKQARKERARLYAHYINQIRSVTKRLHRAQVQRTKDEQLQWARLRQSQMLAMVKEWRRKAERKLRRVKIQGEVHKYHRQMNAVQAKITRHRQVLRIQELIATIAAKPDDEQLVLIFRLALQTYGKVFLNAFMNKAFERTKRRQRTEIKTIAYLSRTAGGGSLKRQMEQMQRSRAMAHHRRLSKMQATIAGMVVKVSGSECDYKIVAMLLVRINRIMLQWEADEHAAAIKMYRWYYVQMQRARRIDDHRAGIIRPRVHFDGLRCPSAIELDRLRAVLKYRMRHLTRDSQRTTAHMLPVAAVVGQYGALTLREFSTQFPSESAYVLVVHFGPNTKVAELGKHAAGGKTLDQLAARVRSTRQSTRQIIVDVFGDLPVSRFPDLARHPAVRVFPGHTTLKELLNGVFPSPSPGGSPFNRLGPNSPLNPASPYFNPSADPNSPFNPLGPNFPNGPLNPSSNPYSPFNPDNPFNEYNPSSPYNPNNAFHPSSPYNPNNPYSPLNPASPNYNPSFVPPVPNTAQQPAAPFAPPMDDATRQAIQSAVQQALAPYLAKYNANLAIAAANAATSQQAAALAAQLTKRQLAAEQCKQLITARRSGYYNSIAGAARIGPGVAFTGSVPPASSQPCDEPV